MAVAYAALGTAFTFLMTALGASLVFLFKKELGAGFQRVFLGFAAGVMIAASVWSLLNPAIEMAEELKRVLREKGCTFAWESPTNQQFVILEDSTAGRLKEQVVFSFWEKADETHTVVRFVTSWATQKEEIEALRHLDLS